MSALSDEAAAGAAARAGDRARLARRREPIYAMEPASFRHLEDGRVEGRLCSPPMILFTEWAPWCTRCCSGVEWGGPPRRKGGWWFYVVRCACGFDVIRSHFRLCVGGPREWWEEQGWTIRGR